METCNTTALIFVYGSLKRGHTLHFEIEKQHFVGTAESTPQYRLFDLGEYPGLVKAPTEGHSIRGELYRVDQACLTRLDIVEGVPEGLYVRERITLHDNECQGSETETVWAWFYLADVSGMENCGVEWP